MASLQIDQRLALVMAHYLSRASSAYSRRRLHDRARRYSDASSGWIARVLFATTRAT